MAATAGRCGSRPYTRWSQPRDACLQAGTVTWELRRSGATAGYAAKARESLASAEADFAASRYNSCARGAYYALLQAAIAALLLAGEPLRERWSHQYVQSRFSGVLIGQRKLYPSALREALSTGIDLRRQADYEYAGVGRRRARSALTHARRLVHLVEEVMR